MKLQEAIDKKKELQLQIKAKAIELRVFDDGDNYQPDLVNKIASEIKTLVLELREIKNILFNKSKIVRG